MILLTELKKDSDAPEIIYERVEVSEQCWPVNRIL